MENDKAKKEYELHLAALEYLKETENEGANLTKLVFSVRRAFIEARLSKIEQEKKRLECLDQFLDSFDKGGEDIWDNSF